MTQQPWFPTRWPPTMADELQLYSFATPNGQKISICLEEMGICYDAHLINIIQDDQSDADFLKLSPNGKIPAILDPSGPDGKPFILSESVAILIYLADKTGLLLPQSYSERLEHLQWLFFQSAHIGPMFGQFGHFFVFAKDKTTDSYGQDRYTTEVKRLLSVLNTRLEGRSYIMHDYSIVDIAIVPWVDCLIDFYKASEHLSMASFHNVLAWRNRVISRDAYSKGKDVCRLP